MKSKFPHINFQFSIKQQSGQVVIVLLLIMLVALSFVLTLTQRSVNDVVISTQSEQSTRAYSAAEAGIEKALSDSSITAGTSVDLGNNATATITQTGLMPYSSSPAGTGVEYPKIGRETTAQVWFVDPSSVTTPPVALYNSGQSTSRFDVYYGNDGTTDLPAIEVTVVMFANNTFSSRTYYYDSNPSRAGSGAGRNGFTLSTLCGGTGQTLTNSILGTNRKFYCRQTVPSSSTDIIKPGTASTPCTTGANACTLVMTRIRFLYINENHSLAVVPNPTSGGNRLPPQVQLYNSVGAAGQSQKQIQAFRVKDVVLPWFDFAIFSTNDIKK